MRLLVLAILVPALIVAQVGTATLSGTVVDASGAVISGAEVILDHAEQQLTRSTLTGAEGQYVIPAIPPGSYKLTIRKEGFRDSVNTFPLSTGQSSTLDVTLQLPTASQTVEVTAAPPLLQTTTATVGSSVESKQITQLPLLGRNFTSLLMIMPGVSSAQAPRGGPFSVGGSGNNPNVFGQRWRNNNYTLDGVSNNEPLFNGIPMLPPPEALAEMKVESGMSSGAYGHASGANINVVSKSGTNAFHGDLWEYLRNDKLDARSFFVPSLGPLRWNQFGAAAGGPLAIPKILPRERGWYVFGYYEGIRIRRAANASALVPTGNWTVISAAAFRFSIPLPPLWMPREYARVNPSPRTGFPPP
ncbi:MAG TPA: carboxypeptidase regulatory-like domain-containing protein [Bryobacteraceae bacterium]|nr:carboxypeptidase regulatory-like domain-containing protein [Bryobacteraceae bacterium]